MTPVTLTLFLASALFSQDRIEYPYSIIPGGIETEPFQTTTLDFPDLGFLHRAWLPGDTVFWVSYRKDGETYWCRMLRRKGELVLADRYGHLIAARCGNRLEEELPVGAKVEFKPPVAELESAHVEIGVPPEIPSELDWPEIDVKWPLTPGGVSVPPAQPPEPWPSLGPPWYPFLPVVGAVPAGVIRAPKVPGGPSVPIYPMAPVVIPEGGTAWLVLIGLIVVFRRKI